jgi:threonine dehydratase
MKKSHNIKLDEINFEAANNLIHDNLSHTPLVLNDYLSRKYNANIYLKLENLQPIGSFKLRGALNKIASLSEEDKKNGVVAVSAGNHAQGVAWAAKKFGVKATIIMPKPSPIVKILNTQALGAEVILEGDNVDESFEFVKDYLKKNDKTYVHPFHDPLVIAGQGSIAFELKEQIDHIDYLFGAIGGGGLLTGMGYMAKKFFPSIKVIGTQALGANSMVQSLRKGEVVKSKNVMTIADGIKVKNPNEEMYNLLDSVVDDVIDVDDNKISIAILELMEQARVMTEGAGAISLAAFEELYQKSPRRFKGKNIVLTICGGNIDINLVDRIIERGLIESNRRIKISILLDDKPGSLYRLTKLVKDNESNVLEVRHERNAPYLQLQESIVEVTLETRGEAHSHDLLKKIEKEFTLYTKEVK